MGSWLWVGIVLFVLVDVLLVAYIVWRRRGAGISAGRRAQFATAWQRIQAEPDVQHAVLDADKLLDQALRARGYVGTVGEKLQKARPLLSDNNAVWQAHKLRNTLAHELDAVVSPAQKERALHGFYRALRDLGAL